MRFAFVLDGLSCGGVERVAITYCNALAKLDHEVTVINLVPNKTEFKEVLSPKVTYREISYGQKMAAERYCTLISRFPWGRFVYPIAYIALMLLLYFRRPFLRRRFGSYDVAIAFSGHYNDLTYVGFDCIPAKKKIGWLHGTVNSYALISDGYINLYKHFQTLICLSEEGRQEFKSAKRWIDLPIVRLYNPIKLDGASSSTRATNKLFENYGDYILTVARLAYPKDIPTIINALEILKKSYGIDKQLVVVGDGPDADRISGFASTSTVSDRVHFVGYVSDPSRYYDACGVFVLSSLSEGLPTVLLEAMAKGKPVVSTNTAGGREILGSGQYGALCEIGSADSMAHEIAQIYNHPELADRYREAGKRRVRDFEEGNVIAKFLDIVGDGDACEL